MENKREPKLFMYLKRKENEPILAFKDIKGLPESTEEEFALIKSDFEPLFTKADLEDSYNKSRKQWDWAGGHLYGERKEEEDLTDFQYPNFDDYYKENYE